MRTYAELLWTLTDYDGHGMLPYRCGAEVRGECIRQVRGSVDQ